MGGRKAPEVYNLCQPSFRPARVYLEDKWDDGGGFRAGDGGLCTGRNRSKRN